MKYKHLVIFASLIFSFGSIQPQFSMARISFEAIQNEHARIETMLRWHSVYQVATVACLLASAGAVGYASYHALNQKDDSLVATPLDGEKFNQLAERMCIYFEQRLDKHAIQKNWIMTQIHWLKKTFFSQVQSIAISIGASIIFNAMNNTLGPISKYIARLNGALDRTATSIFHQNNLEWFIVHETQELGIIATLKQFATLVEGKQLTFSSPLLGQEQMTIEPITDSKRLEALRDFTAYWALLTQQLESILGFMHYKSLKNSNLLMQERMVSIATKVQSLVNDFAQSCEGKVEESENGLLMIHDELCSLSGQIWFEFSNFNLLDTGKRLSLKETAV